jgi:hypothetical protein
MSVRRIMEKSEQATGVRQPILDMSRACPGLLSRILCSANERLILPAYNILIAKARALFLDTVNIMKKPAARYAKMHYAREGNSSEDIEEE